ncbi:bifunctional DNA primase/polymerase [Lentzea flava]|uniref:DNA primase/polymerase bifunctional N-terminal domain-containing protein n=1 Tax=Lentzea flava TaxID=103732 RepID=A0ABQ2UXL5_9PSEU|nr:Bifunctional DNA primase/polymerase, N-terminal [Lentzea flava]GGU59086.1 hypothetical protein GCM10010178_59120 [Lentzea flava]
MRNTVGLLGWRIDSRGHGGFIVAAGSVLRTGRYRVESDRPIADLPAWLLPLLTPPTRAPEPIDAAVLGDTALPWPNGAAATTTCAPSPAGWPPRRSASAAAPLLRAAATLGRLVAGGEYDHDEAAAALHQAAARLRGFPAREATRTITDGLTWGAQRPRRLSA